MSRIPTISIKSKSISHIAKCPCFPIGNYGDKLANSLSVWIYSCYCYCYKKNKSLNPHDIFKKWSESCIDPVDIIYNSVEEGYTRFLHDLEKARINKQPVKFNYSNEFDYHQYSKTLKYNDYVDMEGVVTELDRFLEENIYVSNQ